MMKMMKTLVAAVLAVLALGTIAEGAGQKPIVRHHRVRHSVRSAPHTTVRRRVVKPRRQRATVVRKTTRHKAIVRHRQTTKPR
jgi:hypothetical protein